MWIPSAADLNANQLSLHILKQCLNQTQHPVEMQIVVSQMQRASLLLLPVKYHLQGCCWKNQFIIAILVVPCATACLFYEGTPLELHSAQRGTIKTSTETMCTSRQKLKSANRSLRDHKPVIGNFVFNLQDLLRWGIQAGILMLCGLCFKKNGESPKVFVAQIQFVMYRA